MPIRTDPETAAKCLALAGITPAKPPRPVAVPGLDSALVTVWLPGLVPVSKANQRDHWAAVMRRERGYAAQLWAALRRVAVRWRGPLSVTFHRVGPRLLDDDNLAGAYKKLRDVTAEWLGIDDGDTAAATWAYSQSATSQRAAHGTRVQIVEA